MIGNIHTCTYVNRQEAFDAVFEFRISFNHKFTCQQTYRHCNHCLYMSQTCSGKVFKNLTIKQAFSLDQKRVLHNTD